MTAKTYLCKSVVESGVDSLLGMLTLATLDMLADFFLGLYMFVGEVHFISSNSDK